MLSHFLIYGTQNHTIQLPVGRLTLGRDPVSSFVINHPAISSKHVLFSIKAHEVIIEDLNSTNGTKVNGQPVKKHFLQNGDVIEIAGFSFHYRINDNLPANPNLVDFNVETLPIVISDTSSFFPSSTLTALNAGQAVLRILSGPNAGKTYEITKPLVTIGHPKIQTLSILEKNDGYCLHQIGGDAGISVNGCLIDEQFYLLKPNDVINLGDMNLQFSRIVHS